MCRYSEHSYKTHYACLNCFYTTKLQYRPWNNNPKCTTCGNEMRHMGRDFHAPRRANKRQWTKIKLLASINMIYDSCGCYGPGKRPKTLREAKEYNKKYRLSRIPKLLRKKRIKQKTLLKDR